MLGFSSEDSHLATTIYSKEKVPSHCVAAYQDGIEAFNTAISQNLYADHDTSVAFLDEQLAAQPDESCKVFFSAGAFDARGVLQQKVILEYFLELDYSKRTQGSLNERNAIIKWFEQRFRLIDLDPTLARIWANNPGYREKVLSAFKTKMLALAQKTYTAVPFGRFVFISSGEEGPFTVFDYVRAKDGYPLLDYNGNPRITAGSYQKLAEATWNQAKAIATEYMNWRPGKIYGEDSWLYGAFWRALDPTLPTVRELKEDHFYNLITQISNLARRRNLDTKPFAQIRNLMLKKERAQLASDIAFFDRTIISLYAAPLIPVGMAVGAAGLSYAGLQALPVGTTSFALTSSSLASAANVAAITSLATMASFTGIGTYNAFQAYRQADKHHLPFNAFHAMDHIVGTVLNSFPLAAALPAAVGSTAAIGKVLVLDVKTLFNSGLKIAAEAKKASFATNAKALAQLPGHALKAWATTWWKRKVLIIHLGVDLSTTTIMEVGYRQAFLEGEQKFLYRDAEGNLQINKQASITLGTSFVLGVISKPITFVPTILGRTISWQSLTFLSGTMTQLVLHGQIDWDRQVFDQIYGMVNAPLGEANRSFKLSQFVTSMGASKQYGLLLFTSIVMKSVITPIRTHLIEAFVNNDEHAGSTIRQKLEETSKVDLSDYSDAEIMYAMKKLLEKNPDLLP